ncbi:hypothetical protein N9263_01835 [Candidatus Marinimicrobia bacterium]|nr:hypothetical protein [Candidatus Neomarinimicrobiota bacterium]
MGRYVIKDTKNLNELIRQAKSETSHISSNETQILRIKTLALQIHDHYLSTISEQNEINEKIRNLELSLHKNNADFDYYKDALVRLLLPQEFSLTLVYKSQNNIPYIKGRVYWDNKQREVQIGSIKNVVSQIKGLCRDKLIPPVRNIDKQNIDWDHIKSNPELESAIKYLGKIKFKQYLLKHFEFPKSKSHTVQVLQAEFTESNNEIDKKNQVPTKSLLKSKDWYSLWRRDNL